MTRLDIEDKDDIKFEMSILEMLTDLYYESRAQNKMTAAARALELLGRYKGMFNPARPANDPNKFVINEKNMNLLMERMQAEMDFMDEAIKRKTGQGAN